MYRPAYSVGRRAADSLWLPRLPGGDKTTGLAWEHRLDVTWPPRFADCLKPILIATHAWLSIWRSALMKPGPLLSHLLLARHSSGRIARVRSVPARWRQHFDLHSRSAPAAASRTYRLSDGRRQGRFRRSALRFDEGNSLARTSNRTSHAPRSAHGQSQSPADPAVPCADRQESRTNRSGTAPRRPRDSRWVDTINRVTHIAAATNRNPPSPRLGRPG